ncbi:PHD finger domain protein, partial [Reticulomyxa filosa]
QTQPLQQKDIEILESYRNLFEWLQLNVFLRFNDRFLAQKLGMGQDLFERWIALKGNEAMASNMYMNLNQIKLVVEGLYQTFGKECHDIIAQLGANDVTKTQIPSSKLEQQQQQLLLYQNALQSIEQIRKHCLNKELWYSYCSQLDRLEPGCIVDINIDKLDSQWDLTDVHEDIASIKYSVRAKVLSVANTDKHVPHSREAQVQFDNSQAPTHVRVHPFVMRVVPSTLLDPSLTTILNTTMFRNPSTSAHPLALLPNSHLFQTQAQAQTQAQTQVQSQPHSNDLNNTKLHYELNDAQFDSAKTKAESANANSANKKDNTTPKDTKNRQTYTQRQCQNEACADAKSKPNDKTPAHGNGKPVSNTAKAASASASIQEKKSGNTVPSRRGKKRNFTQIDPKHNAPESNSNKRRKVTSSSSRHANSVDEDRNESLCRVCRLGGSLLCCEGCPAVFHYRCLRPKPNKKLIEKLDEWFCPSCAPSKQKIPLRFKHTAKKWPKNQQPTLSQLNVNTYTSLYIYFFLECPHCLDF